MSKKYVKDGAHNRYPAYCCDDIDVRVGALEEAVAALVAGTVPDGTVTLAKLADDARAYTREINKGTLICEWIGTQEEYAAHIAENGGKPLANVRYTITDKNNLKATSVKVSDYIFYNARKVASSQNRIYIEPTDLDTGAFWFFSAYSNDNMGAFNKVKSSFVSLFIPEGGALGPAETGNNHEICLGSFLGLGRGDGDVKLFLHCERESPYFYIPDEIYSFTTLDYAVRLPIMSSFPTIPVGVG